MANPKDSKKPRRWPTRQVMVGNVAVGGSNPIRTQSMTTSSTRDVEATIEQIIRLADTGCKIARVTVQGMKEADACEGIKNGLVKRGYNIPLVADIHFFPPAAMRVVDFVDKVRINPGNYVDKRASFKVIEYDDESYQHELERIEEKFTPLVEKCKRLKRSMRIGTNHGSLSDRIMNRYGDTPMGMVESAFEFTRVCRKLDYHEIIFSMKSSNPKVMIEAYRLLVAEMDKLGWDYPLHLGVTEAGEGEDGRVKSAMGIGTLLLDGIGDTIRVSLTEDPWYEIDPCNRLIRFADNYQGQPNGGFGYPEIQNRRPITYPKNVSLHRDGSVFVNVNSQQASQPDFYKVIGCDPQFGKPKLRLNSADQMVLSEAPTGNALHQIEEVQKLGVGITSTLPFKGAVQLQKLLDATEKHQTESIRNKFALHSAGNTSLTAVIVADEPMSAWTALEKIDPAVIILKPSTNRLQAARNFFNWLKEKNSQTPVILNFSYDCSPEDLIIQASAECGSLLCDGIGEGLWIENDFCDPSFLRNLSFNILQAARMRTFKTDFISCPSCGRTLFDLQDVTKRIRARTAHLPGVKIAIMGCIVNGPGEMADADFGYVGSKPGMIDLYVGKNCIEKDIAFDQADGRLIDLIKAHGRWIEPEVKVEA